MTFVVTENCIKCKYMDCVEVCPVDCFHEGPNFLVIDPDECIDCTLCEPECPVEAIFSEEELPAGQEQFKAAQRRAGQELAGDHREEGRARRRQGMGRQARQAQAAGALSALGRLRRYLIALQVLEQHVRAACSRPAVSPSPSDDGRRALQIAKSLPERIARAPPGCRGRPWSSASWPSLARVSALLAIGRAPHLLGLGPGRRVRVRSAGRTGSARACPGGCSRRSGCGACGSTAQSMSVNTVMVYLGRWRPEHHHLRSREPRRWLCSAQLAAPVLGEILVAWRCRTGRR